MVFSAKTEVAILLALVAGSAIFLYAATTRWDADLSTSVAAVFAFVLIVSHIWFWLFKKCHSHNLPRLIDYVYLLVGAAGLVLSTTDYKQKLVTLRASSFISHELKPVFSELILIDNSIVARDCDGQAPEKINFGKIKDIQNCGEIKERLKNLLGVLDNSPDFENMNNINSLDALIKLYFRIKALPIDITYVPALRLADRAEQRILNFEEKDSSDTKENELKMRFIGIYFLSAALALRVTKVSVEMFDWYVPKPKVVTLPSS